MPKEDKTAKRYFIKGPYLDRSVKNALEYEYTLTKDSFSSDALYIWKPKGLRLYQMISKFLLIWRICHLLEYGLKQKENQMSPFVCIEPWAGIADSWTHDGNFKKKLFINSLKVENARFLILLLNFKNR